MIQTKELQKKSHQLRNDVLKMCLLAKTGHLTSSFSCVEILVALYYAGIMKHDPNNPKWSLRDRFILSKGQASPILYAVLGDLGYFDKKELDKFAQKDGIFGVHLQKSVPGVEITAGSLGQGFNVATGMALSAKKDRLDHTVFALLGDGECHEGSIWEAVMFASHQNLNNLVAIVDRNFMCATDFTENCMSLSPFADKWRAFGWNVEEIDGHDFKQIITALNHSHSRESSKPKVIIANTFKGHGIKGICDIPLWHSRIPKTKEELEMCYTGLNDLLKHLEE